MYVQTVGKNILFEWNVLMLGTKYSLKLLISIMQITLNEWKIFFRNKKNSYVSPILSCSLIYLGILFAFHFIFAISQLIFVHVDE